MQYCLQNLDRHRFGDVSPKAVEGDYARQGLHKHAYGYAYLALLSHAFHMHTRLAERLGQHAQTQKQTVLIKAVSALLKCDLESKQLEPHHNVLSLIYWLAQRPLDSPWMPDSEDDTDTNSGMHSDQVMQPPRCIVLVNTRCVIIQPEHLCVSRAWRKPHAAVLCCLQLASECICSSMKFACCGRSSGVA